LKIKKEMGKKRIFFLSLPETLVFGAARILAMIHKLIPHQLRLTPDKIKELTPKAWTCDNSHTVSLLNQKFQYPLDLTIKLTYKDYKKNSLL
jgi:hypothetical protein